MNIEKLHLQKNFNYKNTLCKIKKQQNCKAQCSTIIAKLSKNQWIIMESARPRNFTSLFNCERCYKSFDTSIGLVNHYCIQARTSLKMDGTLHMIPLLKTLMKWAPLRPMCTLGVGGFDHIIGNWPNTCLSLLKVGFSDA
jgi:hypothetical protein